MPDVGVPAACAEITSDFASQDSERIEYLKSSAFGSLNLTCNCAP